MKRGKIIWCGVIFLALFCFSSVSKVNAQNIDNVVMAGKLKVVASIRGGSELLETKKAGEKVFVKFESNGPNDCGGYDYSVIVLEDTGTGNQCARNIVGFVDTCDDERTALGFFSLPGDAENFPGTGLIAFCNFIAEVTDKKIRSTGAYCNISMTSAPFDDVGYSSKVSLKGKAKDPKCTP